jgi:sterol desaturase/sphingolipid hydroxylase (fatty acid hydroxylase superfamily)
MSTLRRSGVASMASRTTGVSDLKNMTSTASASRAEVSVKQSGFTFLLAVVEAVCVFYVAAAKSGFVLLSASIAASGWATVLHKDVFRIPILTVALAGSLLSVYLLWHAHRLRTAPAAAWRRRPLTRKERWRIGTVLSLSLMTMLVTVAEIWIHRILHHSAL